MEHPVNYVGYVFTAASYARHTIKHEPVPDRKQITSLQKTVFYEKVLKKNSWWSPVTDRPFYPFTVRRDGAITVRKADLDDVPEGNGKSLDRHPRDCRGGVQASRPDGRQGARVGWPRHRADARVHDREARLL
eukprot:3736712-Prymnesium_polylepis.2